MIKYVEYAVVFNEIPDEITLALNISNCKHNCKGCHSSYLKQDIGSELTTDIIDKLIEENPDITCFCFMGGDHDIQSLQNFLRYIHENYNLKTGFYSGSSILYVTLFKYLDYYKYGPYIPEAGPLTNPTTNQKLLELIPSTSENKEDHNIKKINDITYKFWDKKM